MEEGYLNDRYKSLQHSVVLSFDGMLSDGLAKQLQKHPTSYNFAARRLTEVLDEFVNKDREEFIQKLLDDINELNLRKDKITDKYTKTVAIIKAEDTKINDLNKNLKIQQQNLSSKFEQLKIEQNEIETSLNTTLNTAENKCERYMSSIDAISNQIADIKTQLTSIRRFYTNKSKDHHKILEQSNRDIQEQAEDAVFKNTAINPFDPQINSKSNEINQITRENNKLKLVLEGVYQHVAPLLKESDSSNTIKEDFSNFKEKLNNFVHEQQESIIKNHFAEAQTKLKNINLDVDGFAPSVAELYRQKLLAKEKEYNATIRAARMRRADLKQSLKAASAQLEQMKLRSEQENNLINEMSMRRSRIESSKSALDQAFSKLGL
ncbi:hypothetical protein TVAG_435460 [Trichomonas vaginalis G3]|uniref:Uncharacterized protein n=1 Tax=Trichomonas vaginalis (strain ATCC PRA-98 / G3) TaxID=412133 RepID=A2G8M8_TRIV3|nr:hypothetical protein TVAGG3_0424330 [Trichomonas vaginalis G3]EAX86488.1 hypothetical protein TVAG_435460 [Trichomonas vaginalis G3]KAI5536291.1 hypothetical protein TVAGG3_0424330 [Trichomonas vaginalis G3]|eukprot:XP_001299418.1 hypothetical protein [Trichomonas vaginalis G3]